jgi:hypothetical protein
VLGGVLRCRRGGTSGAEVNEAAHVTRYDGCRQLLRFNSRLTWTSGECVGWVSENDMLLSRVYMDKYKELESLLVEKDLALNETYMVRARL